jgi:hypothetical protein
MLAGSESKTMNHRFSCYWPTEGDRRDFAAAGRVGTWIGANSKVLDKKPVTDCVRLVAEQFPDLTLVEARDHHGRLARWSK